MQFNIFHAGLLLLLGMGVSFISTSTGGGALISIPVLVVFGFQPITAIATVKLGHFGTTIAGLYRFHQSKVVKYRLAIPAMIIASISALLGAHFLLTIPEFWLPKIMGGLILMVLLLMGIYDLGILSYTPHKNLPTIGFISFSLVGFCGGIFGAAAIFATFILLTCFGLTYTEAAGTRKLVGLCVTIVSLLVYAAHHLINYKYGIFLFCGSLIGSYLGAGFAVRKGNQWIRITFFIISFFLAIKLLFF